MCKTGYALACVCFLLGLAPAYAQGWPPWADDSFGRRPWGYERRPSWDGYEPGEPRERGDERRREPLTVREDLGVRLHEERLRERGRLRRFGRLPGRRRGSGSRRTRLFGSRSGRLGSLLLAFELEGAHTHMVARRASGVSRHRPVAGSPARARRPGRQRSRWRTSRSTSRCTSRSRISRRRSRPSLPRASASSTFARDPLK